MSPPRWHEQKRERMSSENRSNLVTVMGVIAGVGLLIVGGAAFVIGAQEVRSEALSLLAAAACFAVSTTALGLVFKSAIRK